MSMFPCLSAPAFWGGIFSLSQESHPKSYVALKNTVVRSTSQFKSPNFLRFFQ